MSEKYKLYYFNARGRAELARLLFAAADQEFEDVRIQEENVSQFKNIMPFGELPVLEILDSDDKVLNRIAQPTAIVRFLAKRFSLYGKNEMEQAEIDMYSELLTELVWTIAAACNETDLKRKQVLIERMRARMPLYFRSLQKKLAENKTGYLVGDSLSIIDIFMLNVVESFGDRKESMLAKYPEIIEHEKKIKSLPRISQWIANRPKTDF